MRRWVMRTALLMTGVLMQSVAGCAWLDEIINPPVMLYGTRSPSSR